MNDHIYIGTSVTLNHDFGTGEGEIVVNCPAIIKFNYFTLETVYT